MRFDKLNELIPYATGGKAKILEMHPYNGITLALPGRHASDTEPPGGDFCVMIDDDDLDWTKHQFTHTDIFLDLETKEDVAPNATHFLMEDYLRIIQGEDPERIVPEYADDVLGGIHPQTFMFAVQCLAVAEHRRYAKFENKFGGRYLPFRFGTGIVEGLWTAGDAMDKQKKGRPGVEWLEREKGVPVLTKQLISG